MKPPTKRRNLPVFKTGFETSASREAQSEPTLQNFFELCKKLPPKSCILLCLSQFDNKKWGSPSLLLSYKHLKLKLRVLLTGHINCFYGNLFFVTMILASTNI